MSLELYLERNGQRLLQGHRDVRHRSHSLLNAGFTAVGVFKPGLTYSVCYYERCMRSELGPHHVVAICILYFLYFLLGREYIICDNEERHVFVAF